MKKYIDAEAFKRKLIDEKNFFPAMVARALEEMPDADVVKVKHGGWSRDNLKCSVCGKTNPTVFLDEYSVEYRAEFLDYCPNCGAKMDGR